jgi:hypothetical protein
MGGAVSWRGVTLDQRSASMMDEACRLAPEVPVTPTQGSYSGGVGASAGTHDGGGAIDIAASGLSREQSDDLVLAMRRVGWAAWLRTPSEGDWPYHIHGIAAACPDLSADAQHQVMSYMYGHNGLANDLPDTGPRDFDYPGITWEEYLEGKQDQTQEAGDMIVGQDEQTGRIWLVSGNRKLELPQGGGNRQGAGTAAGQTGHVYVDEVLQMIQAAYPGSEPRMAPLNHDILTRIPTA